MDINYEYRQYGSHHIEANANSSKNNKYGVDLLFNSNHHAYYTSINSLIGVAHLPGGAVTFPLGIIRLLIGRGNYSSKSAIILTLFFFTSLLEITLISNEHNYDLFFR